jgi:hypothetical protein
MQSARIDGAPKRNGASLAPPFITIHHILHRRFHTPVRPAWNCGFLQTKANPKIEHFPERRSVPSQPDHIRHFSTEFDTIRYSRSNRPLSAKGRRAISVAAKKRWAAIKAAKKVA